MPSIKALREKYAEDGFQVIGFNSDKTVEEMKSYIVEHGYDGWSHYFLGGYNSPIAKRYWVSGWPTNFLLDRDGKIITRHLRFGSDAGEKTVREALFGKEEKKDAGTEAK